MFEKVNCQHPDKQADRIAGALVDLAYKQDHNPKVAVEVLLGHGICHIINETSVKLNYDDVAIVPEVMSTIKSRKECDPFDENGRLPIFCSPMDSVISEENSLSLL